MIYVVVLVNSTSTISDTLFSYIATTYCIWNDFTLVVEDDNTTISWDVPCRGVDSYTFYYDDGTGLLCQNTTLVGDATSYTSQNELNEIQIAAHRNDITVCSQGMYSCTNPLILYLSPSHQQVYVHVPYM